MRAKGEGGGPFKVGSGWRAYVTVKGKRVYTKIHPTKALAAAAKKELIDRRDDGRLASGAAGTVGQWLTHWHENIADHANKTSAMDRWVIETKIIPALGSKKLSSLNEEDIEEWVRGLGVAPSSQRRYLAPMKTALNVAVKRGKIGYNPAERVTLAPAKRKAQASAFSREDRDAILAATQGRRNAVRWHLSLRLGIRPAEALGLTWPDFDEAAGTITIRHQMLRATGFGLYLQPTTKSPAGERVIRLPKSLTMMLVEHRRAQLVEIARRPERYVFEHEGQPVALMFTQLNGRPIDVKMDTQHWREILDAAGLPYERRYKTRHTGASHMLVDSGGDVAVVAKVLGHSDPAFTYRTYVHPLEEREADLIARMDDADEQPAPHRAPHAPNAEQHPATHDGH